MEMGTRQLHVALTALIRQKQPLKLAPCHWGMWHPLHTPLSHSEQKRCDKGHFKAAHFTLVDSEN